MELKSELLKFKPRVFPVKFSKELTDTVPEGYSMQFMGMVFTGTGKPKITKK